MYYLLVLFLPNILAAFTYINWFHVMMKGSADKKIFNENDLICEVLL